MVCQSISRNTSLYYIGGGSPLGDGVEISTFTSTLGFGETPSSLEVEVLWSPCSGFNAYIDPLCIGKAVIFTSNSFVFSGIVKKWTYNESDAGIKHKISIVDPRDLLSMVKVSLSSYHCILTKDNFMNVLNYIEGYSTNGELCNLGIGSPGVQLPAVGNCSTWGTAGYGQRGVSYSKAIDGIIAYNPYMVTTAGTYIYLNFNGLSDILRSRAPYAVTTESNMPLSQLIQSACDACAMEYMVNLDGFTANFTYIDRSIPVNIGYLEGMVSTARGNGTLISSDIGREEAKEVTSRAVFGDKINYIKENNYPDGTNQKMFMGWVGDTAIVRTVPEFASIGAPIDMRPLKLVLSSYGVGTGWIADIYNITEKEVLSLGSLDFWKTISLTANLSIGYKAGLAIFGSGWIQIGLDVLKALAAATGAPAIVDSTLAWIGAILGKMYDPKISGSVSAKVAFLFDDVVYTFLKEWADENYGKQWLIPIVGNSQGTCINHVYGSAGPRSAVWAQGEAGTTFIADTPVDSAYPDSTNILGLTAGTYDTTLFETDEGKICTIIAFPALASPARYINWGNSGANLVTYGINFEALGEHYQKNGYIYMKADTTGEAFNIGGTLHALIKTPFIPLMPINYNALNSHGLIALGLLLGMSGAAAAIAARASIAGTIPSEINILKSAPAVGPFTACAVPMKSNMYCYGPWTWDTGYIGETEIVDSPDLNPWQYGGVANMVTVGLALASAGLKSRNRSETGRVELAEAPAYSLGNIISNGDGPLLTSVVCRFDGGGVTTSYEFKTYTQKFGNYAKELAERTKGFVASRREIYKVVRNQRQKQITLANKTRKDAFKSLSKLAGSLGDRRDLISGVGQRGGTLQRLLFSFYPNQEGLTTTQSNTGGVGTSTSTVLQPISCSGIDDLNSSFPPPDGMEPATPGGGNKRKLFGDAGFEKSFTIEHFENSSAYEKYAICSLDALFSPISLKGSGGLSKLADTSGNNLFKNKPRPSMPPFIYETGEYPKYAYGLEIKNIHLNPILTKSFLSAFNALGSRASDTTEGVSIQRIAFGDDPNTLLVITQEEEDAKQNATDYRFSALKGPLMLHSWGYDTNGKPIPNAVDNPSQTENGEFVRYGLMDRFMKDWTKNPKTWPVGPVDLRWDRERGVWVSPPAERIVIAELLTDMDPLGVAGAILLNPDGNSALSPKFYFDMPLYGPEGQNITEDIKQGRIILVDYLKRAWKKGARVYASHIGDAKYIILDGCNACTNDEGTCGGEGSLVRVAVAYDNILKCGQSCQGDVLGWDPETEEIILVDVGIIYDSLHVISSPYGTGQVIWCSKMSDSGMYEVVMPTDSMFPHTHQCSCGTDDPAIAKLGKLAGLDFNTLPVALENPTKILCIEGACLKIVDTINCIG